jgi:hypothetical protein
MKISKFSAGKASVLALTAVAVFASFLLGKSITSASAHCGGSCGPTPTPDACNQEFTYEKSSDYDDARVHFEYEEDEHWNPNYKRRISLTSGAGYEIVDIWLEVDGIDHQGWDLHFTSALNNYNPNPGGVIDNAKAVVKKVCITPTFTPTATPTPTTKIGVCNNDSYDNYGGDDGIFDPETEEANDELCENKQEEDLSTTTPTPTEEPSTSPSATPTPENNVFTNDGGDGLGCAVYDCSGNTISQGQVLGASTMAGAGSFAENIYLAIMTLGGTLSAFGIKGFKKASK